MQILTAEKATSLVVFGTAVPIFTILTCWLMALSLGHVPLWPWPMISDCGVEAPEKYLFRIGLVVSATLMATLAPVVRDFIKVQATLVGARSSGISPEEASVPIAQIASLGLAVLSCVSEVENTRVHGTAAVIFFLLYIVYQVIISLRISYLGVAGDFHAGAYTMKMAITFSTIMCFVVFILVSALRLPHWTQAIPEWIGVILILLFNGTFYLDFKGKMYVADAYQSGTELQDPAYSL